MSGKKLLVAAATACAAFGFAAMAQAAPSVIYHETFDPTNGLTRTESVRALGWCTTNDGQPCDTGDTGRGAINATNGNPDGFIFWSRQISRIVMFATPDSVPGAKQFSLPDIQDLSYVQFDTDHTNPRNNTAHIANNCGGNEDNCPYLYLPMIQVAGSWYVPDDLSAAGNPQSGNVVRDNGDRVWDTLRWNTDDYDWVKLDIANLPSLTDNTDLLALSDPQLTGTPLAFSSLVGSLDGFGVWINTTSARGNNNTNRRFDNYILGAEVPAVPEPMTLGLLGTGLAAVSLSRRRRRAR